MNAMNGERRAAAMAVELEAQRLLLFVREGKRDETLFGVRARELARVCGPVPEIKTEVLVLVRAAKDCLFSNAVGASVVEVKSDDVRRACRQIRVQCGEQLLEEREPEAKVKTWGATHAVKVSEVPATWDEMQRSGVLYGDGHAHVPVVVTETTVSPRKGAGVTQARRSDNPAAAAVARGHQSSAVKPDPARDKALLEIEAMFGEDAQFDEIAAKVRY